MNDPEEYYDEYRPSDDEDDDRPADGRVMTALFSAFGAYVLAFAWVTVAVIAWFAYLALRAAEMIGLDGFAVVAVFVGIGMFLVGRVFHWYAERREVKLELRAVEDGQWGENA